MKNLIFTAIACLTILFTSFGQLTEGHVQYDIAINMNPDDPSAQMMSSMMEGSTLDIYFQNQNSRSDIQMGKMMKMVIVVEAESGNSLTLMSGMFGKKAIQANINDEDLAEEKSEMEYDINITDETKTILGYTCKKAIMTNKKDGGEMIAWFTEDFSVYKKGINFMQEQIPGAPLEFEMNMNGLNLKATAKKVEKSLSSKKLFDMSVPEGYEITSIDEISRMGGQ